MWWGMWCGGECDVEVVLFGEEYCGRLSYVVGRLSYVVGNVVLGYPMWWDVILCCGECGGAVILRYGE